MSRITLPRSYIRFFNPIILALAISLAALADGGQPVTAASSGAAPPNNCVGIASDSNGFGHVTFQLPPAPEGQIGIIYIRPFYAFLRDDLDALGLGNLAVADHSMTAAGLTASERTNYLSSVQYGGLIGDRCRFNIVGPFIPDVAAAKATPQQYTAQLLPLIGGLIDKNPQAAIFLLNFYRARRADFTATNNGFGMTDDRVAAFNAQIAQFCQANGPLGKMSQVTCLDSQSIFSGMGDDYLLQDTSNAEFKRLLFKPTGFEPAVEQFFSDHPDENIIGDGIHLSYAGRERLMQHMAEIISRLMPI